MKTYLKRFFSFVAVLALASLPVFGAVAVVSPTANTPISALATDAIVTQISFTSASAATINFYDASTAVTNKAYLAYTNRVAYTTNIVSIITNSVGFLQTNTYPGIFTTDNIVAASTRALPLVYSLSCPAGGVVTATVNINVANGLSAQASAAGTLTVNYTTDQ